MKQYTVIYEREGNAWGAYVPDLPGCVAAGSSREEVKQLITEGIALHIELMQSHGETIPEPRSEAEVVAIAA